MASRVNITSLARDIENFTAQPTPQEEARLVQNVQAAITNPKAGTDLVKALSTDAAKTKLLDIVGKAQSPALKQLLDNAYERFAPNIYAQRIAPQAPKANASDRLSAQRRNVTAKEVSDKLKTEAQNDDGKSVRPRVRAKMGRRVEGEAPLAPDASVATPVNGQTPSNDVLFDRALANLRQITESEGVFTRAQQRRLKELDSRVADFQQWGQALGPVLSKPEKQRTADEKKEVRDYFDEKRSIETKRRNILKFAEPVAKIQTAQAQLVEQFFDLRGKGSLDTESTEGDFNNAILKHLAGHQGAGLTTEQAAKVDALFADPNVSDRVRNLPALLKTIDQVGEMLGKLPPGQQDTLGAEAKDFFKGWAINGKPPTNAGTFFQYLQQQMMAGMAPPQSNQPDSGTVTSANANAVTSSSASGGSNPSTGPDGSNWYGLSKARRHELTKAGHTELLQAIDQYNSAQAAFYVQSGNRLSAMQGLLHSGMPIEAILVMFMALMTENEEHKLKVKMAEVAVAESFERTNRKIDSDCAYARDVLKSLRGKDNIAPENEEFNVKYGDLRKKAGEIDVPGVTAEQAKFKVENAQERLCLFHGAEPPPGMTKEQLLERHNTERRKGLEPLTLQGIKDMPKDQLEIEEAKWPQEELEQDLLAKEIPATVTLGDVSLNPSNYGFSTKSSSILTQEMQAQMQSYKQMIETMSGILRMLQDMVQKIVQNIR